MKPSSILLLILSLAVSVTVNAIPQSAMLSTQPGNLGSITASTGPQDPRALIEESCRLASTFDGRFPKEYCLSTLNSVPINPTVKMSMHELASIGLDLLIRNVTSTREKIKTLLAGPAMSNPDLKDCLEHCASMYDEATDKMNDALKDIKKNEYAKADRRVSMIQGDGSECEAEFREKVNLPSPLTRENLDCEYLSGMTTLLIRFFDKSYTPWGMAIVKTPIT